MRSQDTDSFPTGTLYILGFQPHSEGISTHSSRVAHGCLVKLSVELICIKLIRLTQLFNPSAWKDAGRFFQSNYCAKLKLETNISRSLCSYETGHVVWGFLGHQSWGVYYHVLAGSSYWCLLALAVTMATISVFQHLLETFQFGFSLG